jgi:hypothetical protein
MFNMRRTQPGWTWNGPDIADAKAPLAGITVARDGNIWARVATPSELIPEAERAPLRDKAAPVQRWRAPTIYEVYSSDGRFLGRIPMPQRTTMLQADGEYFWGTTRDDDDLPSVVRFRVVPPFRQE